MKKELGLESTFQTSRQSVVGEGGGGGVEVGGEILKIVCTSEKILATSLSYERCSPITLFVVCGEMT